MMTFMKRFFGVLIAVVVIGSFSHQALAQSGHFSSASLGMGGTGAAYLDTYHANFVNPANLMLNSETKPSLSVGLLGGLSATAGGSLVNISAYNKHFTTGELVNTEQALNDFFGPNDRNHRRIGMEFGMIPLGVSWRGETMGMSLALRSRTLFDNSINRGYAEVMLSGLSQEQFGEPTPVNFSSEAVAFSEVSVGFSMQVLEMPELLGIGENVKLYAAAAPKYIVPHYTSGFDFNSTLQVTDREIIHDFEYTFQTIGGLTDQLEQYRTDSQQEDFDGAFEDYIEIESSDFTETQGSGLGVDLGGTIEMDMTGPLASFFSWAPGEERKLRVGLSMSDIGSITYDNNAGSFSADSSFTWDGIDFDEGFGDAFTDSVSQDIYLNYEPGSKEKITKKLPTKVHLGTHLQLGNLAFAVDLTKGLNEAGMNSKRLAVGIGAEYKIIGFIPVRAGYRTGGLTSSSVTLGTGLEFRNVELSVGMLAVPNSENRGGSFGGAWSGLILRF